MEWWESNSRMSASKEPELKITQERGIPYTEIILLSVGNNAKVRVAIGFMGRGMRGGHFHHIGSP